MQAIGGVIILDGLTSLRVLASGFRRGGSSELKTQNKTHSIMLSYGGLLVSS